MAYAIAVDIDGTLVDIQGLHDWAKGIRKDYDYYHSLAISCPPIPETVSKVQSFWDKGLDIVLITVRDEKYREQTIEWLSKNNVPYHRLYMRPTHHIDTGDVYMKDMMVDWAQDDGYDFLLAYEDNPQMVKMFQGKGIETIQVPGWP